MLIDLVRQAAPHFDRVRIVGTEDTTKAEAYTDDKNLFLFADLKTVVPDLSGEFGLGNLPLLRGLLDFASYKADSAKFQVRRMARDGFDHVAELEFADATGGHTRFKTINPRMMGDRASITQVTWGSPIAPSKAKLTEVIQLTGMLSQVDQHFSVSHANRTLFLTIGGKGASSHNATVALATDVASGPLPTKQVFRAAHFLAVLKNAGNLPCLIRFAEEGLCEISIETEHGLYVYTLRGVQT